MIYVKVSFVKIHYILFELLEMKIVHLHVGYNKLKYIKVMFFIQKSIYVIFFVQKYMIRETNRIFFTAKLPKIFR